VKVASPSTPGIGAAILAPVGGYPNRLNIPDARGQGASLRVTRHHEQRKVVLSHWRDGVCVASTPIEMGEVPALIGVLADALGDALVDPEVRPDPARRRPSVAGTVRNWFRPKLVQLGELRLLRDPPAGPRDR
jgi:hypothetical protein